jgi:hypothetical protein
VWPVTLLATLAFAPGCSGGSEEKAELIPVCDSRGILTYRYASAGRSAPASSTTPGFVPTQRQQFCVEDRQPQQSEWAYQDVRREIEDQRRREQQELQAYQETWRQYEQEQRRQQLERERVYQQQQREAIEQQRQWAQAEAWQRQRAAQELDAALQRSLRQQQEMMLSHRRH